MKRFSIGCIGRTTRPRLSCFALRCLATLGLLLLSSSAFPAVAFTGKLSLRESSSWIDANSVLGEGKKEVFFDESGDLRLMASWSSPHHAFNLHYEISGTGGDIFSRFQTFAEAPMFFANSNPDTTKWFHLTRTLSQTDQTRFQHRIDRLSYQYSADWGTVTLGRDVVTWGNGLVFNPLDLLNPFSPDDIERDYKVGDDLLLFDLYPAPWNGNLAWQLLIVPHRNPHSGHLSAEHSSIGIKTHFFLGPSEWDAFVAMHNDEAHIGLGSTHTLGGAVLRSDLLIGFPEAGPARISAVVNMDYSWTMAGRNTYGLLEYYYQSIGVNKIQDLFTKTSLLERLARGELYTYGKHYLSAALQVELHPLLHAHITSIMNLGDGSLLFQPYLLWDPQQNLQVALGARLFQGATNTEYGSIALPHSQKNWETPNSLFVWVKWYF